MSTDLIKEALKDIIPPERREELVNKYNELNYKISELESQLVELRKKKKQLEKILVAIGVIEKPGASVNPRVIRGGLKATVRKYILSLGKGAEFRFSDIVKATGMTRGTVYMTVKAMEEAGEIEKVGRGVYKVVGEKEEEGASNNISAEGASGEDRQNEEG